MAVVLKIEVMTEKILLTNISHLSSCLPLDTVELRRLDHIIGYKYGPGETIQ